MKIMPVFFLFVIVSCRSGSERPELKMIMIDRFQQTDTLIGVRTEIAGESLRSIYFAGGFLIGSLYPGEEHAFRAYDIRTERPVGDFCRNGRGSGEFIQPTIIEQNMKNGENVYLWIKDGSRSVSCLNLNETFSSRKTSVVCQYEFARPGKNNLLYESGSVFVWGDSSFLMNISSHRKIQALGAGKSDMQHPVYLKYDYKKDKADTIPFRYYFLTASECLNTDGVTRAARCPTSDVLLLFNTKTGEETVLCRADKRKEELSRMMEVSSLSRENMDDFGYIDFDFKNDLLFALYAQNTIKMQKEERDELVHLHVFDLQGRALFDFVLKEAISSFCFDGRDLLYGKDPAGRIYKYDVNAWIGRRQRPNEIGSPDFPAGREVS